MVQCLGLRVHGFRFRVGSLRYRVQCQGFRFRGRVNNLGLMVKRLGFRVQGVKSQSVAMLASRCMV
jgi:hypothetical protein